MNIFSLLSSAAIVLCLSYVLIKIIEYVTGASGSPDLKICTNEDSVFINSSKTFYFELFRFIFEYEGRKLVHFRDDLSLITKAKVFEKFVRTADRDVIINYTILSNSTNNFRLVLKSSSYIIIQNINPVVRTLILREERSRLESLNLIVVSQKLIFDNTVLELSAINRNISININEIINKSNNS